MERPGIEITGHDPDILTKIELTQPYLENLAQQILDQPPDKWNVLIGDDAGGRLVAKYVREIMRAAGRDVPPTFFIAGSSTYRNANGEQPYHDYLDHVSQRLGEPMRPLIVTESIGSGSGMRFLQGVVAEHSTQTPEVAALAVSGASRDVAIYVGGVGAEAVDAVWHGFESPPQKPSLTRRLAAKALSVVPSDLRMRAKRVTKARLSEPTGNLTVGIAPNPESDWPVVELANDRDTLLSNAAYAKITDMAHRYVDSRHFPG